MGSWVRKNTCLQLNAGKGHEGQGHQPHGDEGDAQASQSGRYIAVFHLFPYAGQGHDSQSPTHAGTHPEHHAFAEIVVPLYHEERAAKDGAVYGDEWEENAQSIVKGRHKFIQKHLQDPLPIVCQLEYCFFLYQGRTPQFFVFLLS